ncbi:MAG: Fic family protein [Bacteroidales bacterium]|nr:Fic family protein [Bacteroidales bacterium]
MGVFDEYIHGGNPSQKEKSYAWQTAIGLQDVDGLKPSEYLLDSARQNIEGDITINEVKARIDSYYQSKGGRLDTEDRTEEADKVSARIAEILTEPTFNFSPEYLFQIHRRLFSGIHKLAGSVRTYNITKKEWVLDGDTVLYSSYDMIDQTLDHDFREEKNTDYSLLNAPQAVRHIARFISGIWQIHPFCEGNTRTTAVFAIKYLRSFGFNVDNDVFSNNSWYFRNALVRSNYVNYPKNIHADFCYLNNFFENLLLNGEHSLKNRIMHVSNIQGITDELTKSPIGTLDGTMNVTLDELALLKILRAEPKATQVSISSQIGKSLRTVKRLTVSLTEKGYIKRENGKRNGFWVVLI